MKKRNKNIVDIFARYLILIALSFGNLALFYFIFTPLTIYPLYFILNLFYTIEFSGAILFIGGHSIEIIGACIAGSAYYLLLILNLTTKMPLKTRISGIFYSFLILLLVNILRIFILVVFFINQFSFFDIIHKILWHFLSTIFVVAIWFSEVKIFRIKNIPVYSDLKYLKKFIKK